MPGDHLWEKGASAGPIYTIGLAGRGLPDLEDALERYGITTLVDVRTEPGTGEPDAEALAEECRVVGLGYVWMGDRLGDRPRHPSLLTPEGGPDWIAVAQSPMFQAGIGEVLTLAAQGAVAVVCSEDSPEACHRSFLIATHLEDQGIEVLHIRDGHLTRHQRSLGL